MKLIRQLLKPVIMKTRSWITLLLILAAGTSAILLSSCEKLKEATTFKVKYDLPDSRFSIDTSTLLKTEMVLYSQSYPAINIDSIVGKISGLVEKVSFYKLRFSVVTPQSAKINWLNSARVTVSQNGGLPTEIANSGTINPNDNFIDFKVSDTDIYSTVQNPFVITVYGSMNGTIPTLPMEMLMESGIEITVSPLK
jgi:hypothetical protein